MTPPEDTQARPRLRCYKIEKMGAKIGCSLEVAEDAVVVVRDVDVVCVVLFIALMLRLAVEGASAELTNAAAELSLAAVHLMRLCLLDSWCACASSRNIPCIMQYMCFMCFYFPA